MTANINLVTPTTCKALLDAGYQVTVERSKQRIFEGSNKKFKPPLGNCLCYFFVFVFFLFWKRRIDPTNKLV